jgi:hypothetical protein
MDVQTKEVNGHKLRVTTVDNKDWFVAEDVATILQPVTVFLRASAFENRFQTWRMYSHSGGIPIVPNAAKDIILNVLKTETEVWLNSNLHAATKKAKKTSGLATRFCENPLNCKIISKMQTSKTYRCTFVKVENLELTIDGCDRKTGSKTHRRKC